MMMAMETLKYILMGAAPELAGHLNQHPCGDHALVYMTWGRSGTKSAGSILDSAGHRLAQVEAPAFLFPPTSLEAGTMRFRVNRAGTWAVEVTNLAGTTLSIRDVLVGAPTFTPQELRELARTAAEKIDPDTGWQALDAEGIAQAQEQIKQFSAEPRLSSPAPQDFGGLLANRIQHPGWIPFAADHAGNYLGYDTVPGPRGTPGQIVEFGADYPTGGCVLARSFADYGEGKLVDGPAQTLSVSITGSGLGTPTRIPSPDIPHGTGSLHISRASGFSFAGLDAGVRSVSLSSVKDVDFTGIHDIELVELDITGAEVPLDLTPLAKHPSLRVLKLGRRIAGVETLADLPSLEVVELPRGSASSALQALARNPRIAEIILPSALPLDQVLEVAKGFEGASQSKVLLHKETSGAAPN